MSKVYLNNELGNVEITEEAIAQFAGTQALECYGVVGMAAQSVVDGVMHLLKRENLARGIEVDVEDNVISIEFHIIVAYDLNIVSICNNLIENVRYKVQEFTGMKVGDINVVVEGVKVID